MEYTEIQYQSRKSFRFPPFCLNGTETEQERKGNITEGQMSTFPFTYYTRYMRIDTNSGLCAARTISAACRHIRSVYVRYVRSRASPASNCITKHNHLVHERALRIILLCNGQLKTE